jgi:hypothetical protein
VLTCVTDTLSIGRIFSVAGFAADRDVAGARWPREIVSARFSATDIN